MMMPLRPMVGAARDIGVEGKRDIQAKVMTNAASDNPTIG